MAQDKELTREERLAAKLRENLHRRKAQSRELSREQVCEETKGQERPLPKAGPNG